MTVGAIGTGPVDLLDLPEFDVRGPDYTESPLEVISRARQQAPMARSRRGIEILTYDLVSTILTDDRFDTAGHDHYRKLGAPDAVLRFVDDGMLLTMERPHHDRVRRVLARAFSIRRIDEHRSLMHDVAEGLLAGFVESGSCELVGDLSGPYAMEVLCRLIGVPVGDIARFSADAHALHLLGVVPMAPGFPSLEVAYESLERYVLDLVEQRRQSPEDDFISAVIQAEEIEGRLSPAEVVGNLVNLLFAGDGTTKMQLASTVRAVIDNGLWEQVAARPDLVPSAVEEAMRFYPVTQFVVRIAQRDADIDGVIFPKGSRVILNLLAASRDPARFDEPDRFDITRGERHSRLPFGWGVHHCLGHALARASMEEAMLLLLSRLTDVAVTSCVADAPPSAMLNGPGALHISFAPRQPVGS